MLSVVDVNREGRALMERMIESWQSIPVKVLIFIVGVVGVYALGTLLLGPVYWAGQKFGEMVYNYLF